MISKIHTKYIQSLQHKKFRDADRVFIAEGPKVVTELLASGKFVCQSIFAGQQWFNENVLLQQKYPAVKYEVVNDFELEKISALTTPNRVIAVFDQLKQQEVIDPSGKLTLALDTIQDPGNLGTIIRIADWFGVQNIICAEGCADMYNQKVVQSTMGSLGRVNIVYAGLANWLQGQQRIKIYGASLNGTNIKAINSPGEAIIVVGNEAHGISDEVLKLVSEKITIPKIGVAESLNAAVATGIILSHFT